jgi:hypothetical protein
MNMNEKIIFLDEFKKRKLRNYIFSSLPFMSAYIGSILASLGCLIFIYVSVISDINIYAKIAFFVLFTLLLISNSYRIISVFHRKRGKDLSHDDKDYLQIVPGFVPGLICMLSMFILLSTVTFLAKLVAFVIISIFAFMIFNIFKYANFFN